MKTTIHRKSNPKIIPFPNAACREYKLQKALNSMLTAATGAGIATALLCILTFF